MIRRILTAKVGVAAALAISLTSLVLSMSGIGSARSPGPTITATTAADATAATGATVDPKSPDTVDKAAPRSQSKTKSKSKKSKVASVDGHRISAKPLADGLLLLGANKKLAAAAIPKVEDSDELDGKSLSEIRTELTPSCPPSTVDIGTWCLEAEAYPVPTPDQGENDYFWASQACVEAGGWLPTAAQLIGAAKRVRLESTIHDDPATALVDEEPANGLKDEREMSSTLVTTAAGSSAAGSEGVSEGSTGNPEIGEPNPTPEPAVPEPQTLQYVTVYSNGTKGGFAGSEPVATAQNFRCAYNPTPGAGEEIEE